MKNLLIPIICLCWGNISAAQTVGDLIKEVNFPLVRKTVDELSGEIPVTVNGAQVTIRNRKSNAGSGNDLAANYIKEKLNSFGLTGNDQIYKAGSLGGRNVYATQLGKTKPNDIFLICGHYDAVADYCADDDATGVVAALEAARILSKYCFENTLVYAFWDEEETGLNGSKYFANDAAAKNQNIIGVLNIDMAGYDGNNDKVFDIDVNNNAKSLAIKDLLIQLVTTHNLNLVPKVVNPGTTASDHASFWSNNYGALLLGESWETKDQTPFYHSSQDRSSTLNWPYYNEMVKLALAYMATVAVPLKTTLAVTQNNNVLTLTTLASTYQWVNCDKSNEPIQGATGTVFTATSNGNYAVMVKINGCSYISSCYAVTNTSNDNAVLSKSIGIYPNPIERDFIIDLDRTYEHVAIEITDVTGKIKYSDTRLSNAQIIPVQFNAAPGIYVVSVIADEKRGFVKLVKK